MSAALLNSIPQALHASPRERREDRTAHTGKRLRTARQLTLLGNLLSRSVETLKSRDASRSGFIAIQPGYGADEIDRGSRPDMLEMGLGQANRARAAHAKSADPLRHRRFDP